MYFCYRYNTLLRRDLPEPLLWPTPLWPTPPLYARNVVDRTL